MKNKALFSIFILTCLLHFSGCKSKQTSVNISLDGSWTGEAYQYDINETWSIDFRCNMKKKIYLIQYPSLGCSGNWNLEQRYNNIFEFRELLNKGLDVCTNNGKIVLDIKDDNNVAFFYYWPDDKTLNASGYLKRNTTN